MKTFRPNCSRSFSTLLSYSWWLLIKNSTVSSANMVINLGLWMSPSCLVQVSQRYWKASASSTRKGFVLAPEAAGKPISLWKAMETMRNNNHSKNDWQIQSSINTRVHKHWRSNLNLRCPIKTKPEFGSWASEREARAPQPSGVSTTIFVTPNLVFHPAAASQSRFLGMCPEARGC